LVPFSESYIGGLSATKKPLSWRIKGGRRSAKQLTKSTCTLNGPECLIDASTQCALLTQDSTRLGLALLAQ
jgi:hypothetical protein